MTLASAFDFPLTAPWQVRRVTQRPINHILTNTGCWSPDGQWILYDLRSDLEGTLFDSPAIERVHSATGEVESLFLGKRGAKVGVVTHSPPRMHR